MADITLNVEVRERTGTGGARDARRQGKVPGVLYGGVREPVAIAVNENAFKKALYTGKLLGHLITLKYGNETQPVIARDVQFHPVTDAPVHFDLMRVDEHQLVKIAVPVHFKNADTAPFVRAGGALEIVRHEIEIYVPADEIPEELTYDLAKVQMGVTIRIADLDLPAGAEPAIRDRNFVVATVKVSSAALSQAADEAADAAAAEEAAEVAADDAGAAEGETEATDAADQG
jgi:large subunit ribosomal protein L25